MRRFCKSWRPVGNSLTGCGSSFRRSPTSVFYAISSLDEVKAYVAHPILGPRLVECAGLVFAVNGKTARQVFGAVDEAKFRSSMTLFVSAAPDERTFRQCLEKYFAGAPDPATLAKL
jgi:uncharacterized protein (DUF1810 family)